MASIRKDGSVWRAQVAKKDPKGTTVRKSGTFDSKREAQEWSAAIELEIKAGDAPAIATKTFGQLLEKYRDEVSVTKRGEKWERDRIGLILRDPLAEVKLSALDKTHIAAWRDRRVAVVSAGSVRREWTLLSAACSVAINEWGWLSTHPMQTVKRPAPPKARDRLPTQEEIERLLFVAGYEKTAALTTKTARVGAAIQLAIETGMRAGELCALTWADVNLDNRVARVTGESHGAGKTQAAIRDVPLTLEAVRLFNQLKSEAASVLGLDTGALDALFRKIKNKAGVEGLHFHDLRAEATTRLSKKLDILSLAKAIGHKDMKMLQVYYRESAAEMAKRLD